MLHVKRCRQFDKRMSSVKRDKHTLLLICEGLSPFLSTTMGLYFKDQGLLLRQMFIFQTVCLKTFLSLEWSLSVSLLALKSILFVSDLPESSWVLAIGLLDWATAKAPGWSWAILGSGAGEKNLLSLSYGVRDKFYSFICLRKSYQALLCRSFWVRFWDNFQSDHFLSVYLVSMKFGHLSPQRGAL